MKSLNKLKILSLFLSIALFSAGAFWFWTESLSQNLATDISIPSGESANTSGYVTLNSAYTRIPVATGARALSSAEAKGYVSAFRVFLPPGTTTFDLRIYEYSGQNVVARYETPPTSKPTSVPEGYVMTAPYSLGELEEGDQYAATNKENTIPITNGAMGSPYLSLERGGWLYVKVDNYNYSSFYLNQFSVSVDAATYNNWFDNYGSNPDGSINWELDVESVTTYTAKKKLPGDIEPQTSPDGDVDIFDYNIFIQYWSEPPTNNPADIDQNGKVDIFDYNLLVGNFGKTSQ